MRLRGRGKRALPNFHILGLNLASRADQDNAGDAFALHALHVPTLPHGFLHARQPAITVPAAALAGGTDGVQGVRHVQHDPLACFNCAQKHLHHNS